ncbi:MAG: 4-hydroxy-tetrahydrodipicolinate reductase [Mangrovibacterium sp.]
MKIALIGYGRMGKIIEQIAQDRGHEVVGKYDISNQQDLNVENLKKADVAIEFTIPDSAIANYKLCFEAGIPVVSGTTGWLEHKNEVIAKMKVANGTFFYASNFSLGVNLFFALNKKLAQLMTGREGYDVSMTEVHHTQKLDAPSGTAITLADGLIENYPAKTSWTLEHPKNSKEMHIGVLREGKVPGIHRVKYESDVDYILIEHNAKNRNGFALGAVLAAEYSIGKKGILTMNDLLNL